MKKPARRPVVVHTKKDGSTYIVDNDEGNDQYNKPKTANNDAQHKTILTCCSPLSMASALNSLLCNLSFWRTDRT